MCEHKQIETMLEVSQIAEDVEGNQWVLMRGFRERCADCLELLGDGYGDVDFYPSKEEAEQVKAKDQPLIGVWKSA